MISTKKVSERKRGRERERRERFWPLSLSLGVHELTCYHAILFPVVGSLMLLVFFYFFEFIQYIYTILTAGTCTCTCMYMYVIIIYECVHVQYHRDHCNIMIFLFL